MKKATFLFVLMFFSLTAIKENVNAEEFPFSGYTISLEEKEIDGQGKIIVTKGGMNPFETTVGFDGYDLYYNGITAHNHHFVIYGYALGGHNGRDYSGFFFVLDEVGNIVVEEEGLLNDEYNENVNHVYSYDNKLMVELQQTKDNDYQVTVTQHSYFLYDEEYKLVKEHVVSEHVKEVIIEDDLLLGRYQSGELFDFGILSSGEIVYHDDFIGVEDGGIYYNEVCLNFLNEIVLNEDVLTSNACIETIGTHYVIHDGETIEFTIAPIIEGVEDGGVYYEPISIGYNGGYVTLNGDSYASHEEIIDIGHYTFLIEGVNGYQKQLVFEIGSVVEGITNNTVYQSDVTINFTGQGYLNNQYITSPFTVENEGEYILKIKGNDGYLESYYFEIEESKDEKSIVDFIQKVDVFVLGTVLVVGIVVIKRKR